jgi:hypothetical protein
VDIDAIDVARYLVARFVGEVNNAYPGVLLGEAPGRFAPYAAGAAGYDGDFPFEASGHI